MEEREELTNLNRIKVALAEKNKSGKWLAEQLGKTDNTVSRWVQNKTQPSLEQLYDIARTLDVDVKDLLNSTKKQ
ncbi:MAG: helix-turn-helix transcriptional regulator [Paludibacteraceae bacterium]|nr:helix-turn-helix transcriptional regulator [Paludibacteraceae bacterium]